MMSLAVGDFNWLLTEPGRRQILWRMQRLNRIWPTLVGASVILITGCVMEAGHGEPGVRGFEQAQKRLGEPVNGIPDYNERTAHHMTNRVRAGFDCGDPSLICNNAPLRPLPWSYPLGEAARFHSNHMHDAECFQHQSCCNLVDNGGVIECDGAGFTCPGGQCDYQPDCPGTSASQRVSMFGSGYSGENIAGGNATGESTICQWYNSPGHHDNMCNSQHGAVGIGHFAGPNCQSYVWGHYWTQDFAWGTPPAGIASASHWGSGASTTFGAAFYDPGATAQPTQARVVIDGVCHTLTREYGDDVSSTYAAQVDPGAGCSEYWFLFVGQGATRFAYPSTGSYLLGSGCTGDYTTNQAAANCEGQPPECNNGASEPCYDGPGATRDVGECSDGTRDCANDVWGPCQGQALPAASEACGDGLDDDCNGVADDGCPGVDGGVVSPDSGPGTDGALPNDGQATTDGSTAKGDGGQVDGTVRGGCSCRTYDSGAGGGVVLLLLVLLLWRRRRRATGTNVEALY